LFYDIDSMPGLRAVAMGSVADSEIPPPRSSVYEQRRYRWVGTFGEGIDHND